MDTFTNNNGTINNGTKPHIQKSRSAAGFSHAAVAKSDVGDFQAGYFVMAEPMLNHQRTHKTNRTPERHLEKHKSEPFHHRPPQQQRERSAKHLDQHSREGEMHGSNGRLTTSPTGSPTRNKRNSPPHSTPQPISQTTHHDSNHALPLSPHKPRKAHGERQHVDRPESISPIESGSPTKDKGPSPPPNRWAGPAFSKAPPPSSLPLPDFPPFLPQVSSSPPSTSPVSSSPPLPQSGPTTFVPATVYYENLYIHPPLYSHPQQQYPPQFAVQLAYADISSQPTLAQLSTDLRKMLNIGQPITA